MSTGRGEAGREGRRRSPRPALRAGLALGVLLLVAIVAVVWVRGGDEAPSVATPLSCPAQYEGDEEDQHVPDADPPEGFDTGDALAPVQAPTRAIICRYDAGPNHDPTPPPNDLTGSLELTEGLEQVAADLSSAPVEGTDTGCSDMGGPLARQLVGLEYDDRTLWISAPDEPNRCVVSTNGEFSATGSPGGDVAKAFADGGWVVPTQGEREVCGRPEAVGRAGTADTLVPGEPVALSVCRTHEDVGVFTPDDAGQEAVLDAIGRLPTDSPAAASTCSGTTSGEGFQVLAIYETGAAVALDVTTGGCRSGSVVSNGDLAVDGSDELLEALREATRH